MQNPSRVRLRPFAAVLFAACFGLAACSAPGRERTSYRLANANPELPFSHAVAVGDTVYVAGTLGIDPGTGAPPADAAEEARLLLDEIRTKLALAGLGMDDLVSVQVFCTDLALYATFNDVYRMYFTRDFPVRTFVGSGPLLRGCRFEVNGIAAR